MLFIPLVFQRKGVFILNKRQAKKITKKRNKALVERYPFLLPRNVFSDEVNKDYNYMFTELDCMPKGWKKAFGYLLCEDIRNALINANMLDEYRILQVKEKYGTLRWYDNGATEEIYDIISKYEHISEFCCITCGKLNVPIFNHGWISPQCHNCFKTFRDGFRHRYEKYKKGYYEETKNEDIEKMIVAQPNLQPTYEVTIHSQGKKITKVMDVSDIIEKINKKQNKIPK